MKHFSNPTSRFKKKNFLLAALAFGFCTNSFTQQIMVDPGHHNSEVPVNFKAHTPKTRATIVSDWYNYGSTVYNMGGTVAYYRNFLFPDSTVQVEFSSGYGYVWKHSVGEVLDLTSALFDATGQTSAGTGMPYTLDSIAIPYRYWRFQTAVPDTLVIQIYKESDITLVPSPGWTSGASYSTVDYDYLNRIGMNESQTIKYLLTSADEINLTQGLLQLPVNMNVIGGGKVAMTVTYLPGNPYNVNDTIDTYASTTPVNQINAFVFYDFNDQDMMYEPMFYNNELAATTQVRYNTSTTGWNGNYIPGTAWLSGIYYGDLYFKITMDTDITGQIEQESFSNFKMYPNPAFDIINFSNRVPITGAVIVDISGKIVLSANGSNMTSLDLSDLSKGAYVLRLTSADGFKVEKQFIKQ